MTYTAEIAASIEAMRSAHVGTSLASKFSTTRMGHQSRHAPLPVRYTRTARKLAHYGAMTPEGCSVRDLQRARDNHRLSVDGIKTVLGTLWSFRLLGWLPSDTNYLEYDQIVDIAASGTRRPRDTQNLMPVWFTRRHTVDELRAFGAGKGV